MVAIVSNSDINQSYISHLQIEIHCKEDYIALLTNSLVLFPHTSQLLCFLRKEYKNSCATL